MIPLSSFAAGELGPSLWSRYDLAKYKSGCRLLKNFIPLPYGGVENRPGTKFIADLGETGRLIPFEFNTEQAYVLIFLDDKMLIAKDGGLVVYPVGHVDEGDVVEIVSPYAVEDLMGIRFTQSADTMFLTHSDYAPRTLTRTDHHEWTFTTLSFVPESDPPDAVVAGPEVPVTYSYEYFLGSIDSGGSNYMLPRMVANGSQWEPNDSGDEAIVDALTKTVSGIPSPWSGQVVFTWPLGTQGLSAVVRFVLFRRLVGATLWDAVETRINASALAGITDNDTGSVTAWNTGGDGDWYPPAASVMSGVWSGSGEAYRDYGYVVSSLAEGGESYPSTEVRARMDNPWTQGDLVTVSWQPAVGANGYNIYKNARGQWGWIGQVQVLPENRAYASPYFEVVNGGDTVMMYVPGHPYVDGDIVQYVEDPDVLVSGVLSQTFTVTVEDAEDTISFTISPWTDTTVLTPKAYLIKVGVPALSFIDDNINPDTTFGYRLPPITDFSQEGNYPRAVALYQQRLMFAGTDNEPASVWGSRSGSLLDFSLSSPLRADDPVQARPDTGQGNPVQHLVPLGGLLIFSTGGELVLRGSGGALAANSLEFNVEGYDGCADSPPPITVGKSVLFPQRNGRVVRDISYNFQVDGYSSNDVTVLANHTFKDSALRDWAYAKSPSGITWCVREDGSVRSFTYLREHEVYAWARHDLAGGIAKSVCSIPGPQEDEVYFLVQRTVDGDTVHYLERMTDRADEDGVFMDCSLTYDGAAATTITGLDHLEGEEVVAYADGNVVEGLTVASGSITLPQAAELVHVGLSYESVLHTLDLDADGENQGRKQKLAKVVLRFRESRGGIFVGPSEDKLYEIPFRSFEGYDEPTQRFTGDKETPVHPNWSRQSAIYVKQTAPLPVTLLALFGDVEVGR